jgi:hypothetical protein
MSEPLAILSDAEIASWYEGKNFSSDWTTDRIPKWAELLAHFREAPVHVIEIGSWEGRSGGRRFHVAYVDGSHFPADVYSDAVLIWSMMVSGGIVIFDDYNWDIMEEHERPKSGVDAFLKTIDGQYHVLHCEYQMVIGKL